MQINNQTLGNSITIIQTTDIQNFIPLLKELEFGDKFSLSVLRWCEIKERQKTLAFWQVYLVTLETETIGVMGLYQMVNSSPNIVWVGWFGLRPKYRQQRLGTVMINLLKKYALEFGFKQLWVFTNTNNFAALSFYEKAGFIKLGSAEEICPDKTYKLSDIILRYELQEAHEH
jgi:RimJ/RimL family protein N-acetyltransferase